MNRFICNKTKNKNKKYFCKCCLQCFISEKILIEHKENCLVINGKQSIKLKKGSISFKNYFLLKFMLILNVFWKESKAVITGLYTEKYQAHIPCSFAYKFVCVDYKFSKKTVFYRGKNAIYRFIEAILNEYDYCKKMIKRHLQNLQNVCRRRRNISIK